MSTELPALERFRANEKTAIALLSTLETLPGLLSLFRCLILGANRQVKGQQAYPRWALGGWQPGSPGRRQPAEAGGVRHAAQAPGTGPRAGLVRASVRCSGALCLGGHGNTALCWRSAVIAPHPEPMAKDDDGEYGGDEKGFTHQPLESALMCLERQASPSLMSALTQVCRIRPTALPSLCSVTLGVPHLPEIQNKEKVTYIMRLHGVWNE